MERKAAIAIHAIVVWLLTRLARLAAVPPRRASRAPLHPAASWRAWLAPIGIVLGLVMQLGLLWVAGEMVDLYVSAVELWAELARKHLELTL